MSPATGSDDGATGREDGLPPLPERLAHLGTWWWRQPAVGEDTGAWRTRTAAQRDRLASDTAGWLLVGRAVRAHSDSRIGGDVAGRTGTVMRLCSAVFADYVMVEFQPVERHRLPRVQMVPVEILEPVGGVP